MNHIILNRRFNVKKENKKEKKYYGMEVGGVLFYMDGYDHIFLEGLVLMKNVLADKDDSTIKVSEA